MKSFYLCSSVSICGFNCIVSAERRFENGELAAGCRPNPQAGSLRYHCGAAILAAGSSKLVKLHPLEHCPATIH
jgi:hypothetical protein